MNAECRNNLKKAIELLEQANSIIQDVLADETDTYDNMSENAQESERGEAISECIDNLEDCTDDLEDLISTLEDIADDGSSSTTIKIVIK